MGTASRAGLIRQLDFDTGLPAYLQIVHQLTRQVASGRLHRGERLPTVRDLANQLGLNFNTVARAYRVLQRRGLISAQRGRGTYVTGRTHDSPATRRAALTDFTRQYVEDARRHKFSDAEIAAAVVDSLNAARPPG